MTNTSIIDDFDSIRLGLAQIEREKAAVLEAPMVEPHEADCPTYMYTGINPVGYWPATPPVYPNSYADQKAQYQQAANPYHQYFAGNDAPLGGVVRVRL